MLITKTDTVRQLVADGEYKKALNIAKNFRRGIPKSDLDAMALAYECMVRPEFYRQIGKDVDHSICEGIDVLKVLYGPDTATL